VTLYQDQLAHSADIRALMKTNAALGTCPLQVIDRLGRDGQELWLGWVGDATDDDLATACLSLATVEDIFEVTVFKPESLAVPFRDSIRSAFSAFIRMKRPRKGSQ
jgi:hypothetical protein